MYIQYIMYMLYTPAACFTASQPLPHCTSKGVQCIWMQWCLSWEMCNKSGNKHKRIFRFRLKEMCHNFKLHPLTHCTEFLIEVIEMQSQYWEFFRSLNFIHFTQKCVVGGQNFVNDVKYHRVCAYKKRPLQEVQLSGDDQVLKTVWLPQT